MSESYAQLIQRADDAATIREVDVVRLKLKRALRKARRSRSIDRDAATAMEDAMRAVQRKRDELYPKGERWFDRIAAVVLAIMEGWGAS